MADYKDKIVVITGGSDGIGKALVAQFLALGAKVATCGRTQIKLDDLAREFNSPNLLVIAADVSQQSDCTSFIEILDRKLNLLYLFLKRHLIKNLQTHKNLQTKFY